MREKPYDRAQRHNRRKNAWATDRAARLSGRGGVGARSQSAPRHTVCCALYRTGIYLAGGGSMLRGLDKRISLKTKLPVHVADDPLKAVARGTGIALKNYDRFSFLI